MKPSDRCIEVRLDGRRLALGLSVAAAVVAGCGGGGSGGKGGAGGGVGGAGGGAGSAGCPITAGVGSVTVEITGLPPTVPAAVTATNPAGGTIPITASVTAAPYATGMYTFTAATVVVPDPIVRTVYVVASVPPLPVCVTAAPVTVTITYTKIPSSNKVWVAHSNAPDTTNPSGFESAAIAATGSPAATVSEHSAAGRMIAFDRDGNLWSNGGTVGDPTVMRLPSAALGVSGTPAPDRSVSIPALTCSPGVTSLAFGPDGGLWVGSTCAQQIMKLSAAQLAGATNVATPVVPALAIPIAAPMEVAGLAFDKAGNLWVAAGEGHVLRFDAATLVSAAAAPARTLTVTSADTTARSPGWLAFDAAGNLWSNDFGGNAVFSIPAASLAGVGPGTAVAPVTITIGVSSLLGGMAFDEGGGLWLSLSAGVFGRLTPGQLMVSSGGGAPTTPERIITSASIGYAEDVALYPAPAALPLYSALP